MRRELPPLEVIRPLPKEDMESMLMHIKITNHIRVSIVENLTGSFS
jgi:hypothetical protein